MLVRDDFCEPCWKDVTQPRAFSVWHSKFYDPRVAEQEPPEVFSPLRQLFYECVDSQDRQETAKAYLAAHLLRRQKVFRLIKESDGGDDEISIALFSDRIGNRLIEVRDPNLSHDELEKGRLRLLERLKELEEGAPAAETETEDDSQAEVEPEADHEPTGEEAGVAAEAAGASDDAAME